MRAVDYSRHTGIEYLQVIDLPTPQAALGEVVVRVRATGINPGALSALNGAYTPIRDLAGVVTATGEGVHNLRVGDAVLGWVQSWSAHAQWVAVPAAHLLHKPQALSWDVAGSLYVTAMAGLAGVQAVRPQPGETVVVAGASGGVGLVSAQLARRAGARVLGLAGPDHAAWLEARGIHAVPYGDGQEERLRAAAGEGPIVAFIDTVGSGSIASALALGVPVERINTVVDFQAARTQGIGTMGTREAGGLPALQMLADLAASGELEIPIAAAYALEEVQEAYRYLAERRGWGKVVLHP